MSETDNNANPSVKESIKNHSDRAINRFMYLIMVLATIALVTMAGSQVASIFQIFDFVAVQERRMDRILDQSEPSFSKVQGIFEDNNKLVLRVQPQHRSDGKFAYGVDLRGDFLIEIGGNPGRLIGIQHKIEGPILNYITNRIDGSVDSTSQRVYEKGIYTPQEEGGPTITENAPLSAHVRVGFPVKSCSAAKSAIKILLEKSKLGKIHILPIFGYINTPPEYKVFNIEIEPGLQNVCNIGDLDNDVVR